MDFLLLLLLKLIITIAFVLGLSILAEKVSPKLSGIISGVPTGTAIILFFYGLEQSTTFAADSAQSNLIGMVGLHVFLLAYYLLSTHKKISILYASVGGIIAYAAIIYLVKLIPTNIFISCLVAFISIVVFTYIFKHLPNHKIEKRVEISKPVLLLRSLVAASIIIIVTSIAQLVGPQWAGLFSAFPTTVFPLLLIIHYTYDEKPVHTIIKNIPTGSIGTILYVIAVFFLYPAVGIILGTIISYAIVIIYLALILRRRK